MTAVAQLCQFWQRRSTQHTERLRGPKEVPLTTSAYFRLINTPSSDNDIQLPKQPWAHETSGVWRPNVIPGYPMTLVGPPQYKRDNRHRFKHHNGIDLSQLNRRHHQKRQQVSRLRRLRKGSTLRFVSSPDPASALSPAIGPRGNRAGSGDQ